MTKRTLESLKAAFQTPEREQREGFSNNYFPFWNMKIGQKAVIRFLPDRDGDNIRGFLVEKVFHTLSINGQKKTVPCLSMYGEECPVCKVSQDYYKLKDEVNGKKYWRKKQYIAQALVLVDPLDADATTGETHEGKVRYIALGYQLYNIIKEAFASDDLKAVPYDFEDGYDFTIKKTEQGKYSTYVIGSKFADNPRELSEEELVVVEEGMIELATLLPKNPTFAKVKAMLDADLNGESFEGDGAGEEDGEEAETPAAKPAAAKPAQKPAPKAEEAPKKPAPKKQVADEADTSAMTDVDAMLAAIKARRAAK